MATQKIETGLIADDAVTSAKIGTLDANLEFGDSVKAIFGAGSDLQIHHDGTNSFIKDTSSNLVLNSDSLLASNGANTQNMIVASNGGAVTLFYAGATKLATTSAGINVTGTVSVSDNISNAGAAGSASIFNEDGTTADFRVESTSNTHMLFVDGGLSRVGIGLTSPLAPLHVGGEAYFNAGTRHYTYDDQANYWSLYTNTDDSFRFNYNGSGADEIVIDTSGNVGIGTTSPDISGFSKALTIDSSDSGIELASSGTIQAIFASNTQGATIHGVGSSGIRVFTSASGSTSERMRIDSSGNVNIGTTGAASGSHKLVVESASTTGTVNSHIALIGDSATNGQGPQILFSESGDGQAYAGGTIGFTRTGSNSIGDLVFGTRGSSGDANTTTTERMRIDSSGRLLVGGTSATFGVLGVESSGNCNVDFFSNSGSSTAAKTELFFSGGISGNSHVSLASIVAQQASGDEATRKGELRFLTANSGGPSTKMIIKADGKVGIGTDSPAEMLHIVGGGNGPEIRMQNSTSSHYIRAYNDNWNFLANSTNTAMTIRNSGQVDFGAGLGIGGTGAANTLDDYEEGTWTPTIDSGGWSVSGVNKATYTKIGNRVTAQTYFDVSGTGNSNDLRVAGLPFTCVVNGWSPSAADIDRCVFEGTYARVRSNTGHVEFFKASGSTSTSRQQLAGNNIGTGYIIFTVIYETS